MTDFRALCARMADELDHYRQLLTDDRRATHALATEARAALAQPEPQGPTDKELAQLFSDSNRQAIKDACSTPERAVALICSHMGFARAVLARYGRPAIEPVPRS